MPRYPLGKDAVLLLSTNGTTYTEAPNVKDVTLNLTKDEADATTRENGGWKATEGTLKDASVEFTMLAKGDETNFVALRQSYLANADLRCRVMSGPNNQTASVGLEAWVAVLSMTRGEPLGDMQSYQFTLKPTNPPAANAAQVPAWVAGAGS